MRLGIVIPLWGREELTRLTLRRISEETRDDLECIRVAVTDEILNGKQAKDFGFEVVAAPNSPLSNKKNAGIQHLRGRVDGVVLLGSDDWAVGLDGVELLERYRALLTLHHFIGPLDMWYLDLRSDMGGHSQGYREGERRGEPIGVGRAMRAEVLESLDWAPRPPGLEKNHDGAMRKMVEAAGFRCVGLTQQDLGVRLVDIKSATSVTPFSRLRLQRESWDEVLKPFPSGEVEDLKALSNTVRRVSSSGH